MMTPAGAGGLGEPPGAEEGEREGLEGEGDWWRGPGTLPTASAAAARVCCPAPRAPPPLPVPQRAWPRPTGD